MEIYRVFDWDEKKINNKNLGSPLYIPRERQGNGRHDIPDNDGVFYGSLNEISAISEALHPYINLKITDKIFHFKNGLVQSIARISLVNAKLIDLTKAKDLLKLNISPQDVATLDRRTTRKISYNIYNLGVDGFKWYSALETQWTNLTLYESRIKNKLKLKRENIKPLSLNLAEVQQACKHLGVITSK